MNTELQQRIIKQATRMFFCNGIKSVTMDMIASQLGISKRTLYAVSYTHLTLPTKA